MTSLGRQTRILCLGQYDGGNDKFERKDSINIKIKTLKNETL